MKELTEQSDWFRRAADVEAETPIAAGPPIVRKWWVKRADYLSAVPLTLEDIVRQVYPMELVRFTNGGNPTAPACDEQIHEYATKVEAIRAATELYRKDAQDALPHGQRDEKAEAGLRLLEAA